MRTISRISIAPVKSLALEHPDDLTLEPWGAVGNRGFFLVGDDDRLVNGAKIGQLVQVRAHHDLAADILTLTFPDGTVVRGPASGAGVQVKTDFYGLHVVASHLVEGPFSDALSAFAGRSLRLARPDEPGAANDVWPASLLSTASVAELASRSGSDVPRDSRRFRLMFEIEGCEFPHEEDTWVDRRVRVGPVVLRVPGPIPRCVVTTQDPSTGRKDFPTLRAIKEYRGTRKGEHIDFGVYGEILERGVVSLGDAVEPLGD
ncbi:MAG TPA: MOSC N-terminal beta barrel domain-containing protein [Actinomycetota bacterium]|nr:MOSC N-terminal beta barrel domain-containing protein [Actinomycetota bacterium]